MSTDQEIEHFMKALGWNKVAGNITKLYKQAENTFNIAVQKIIFQISKHIRVPNLFWDLTAPHLNICFIQVNLFQINRCVH